MNKIEKLIQELCPEGVYKVRLGTATNESTERNLGAKVNRVRSVTNTSGLVDTNTFWENARTSADTSNYKVVRPGMFVYNPSRINVGSIARNTEIHEVIVSPMYVVFEVDETVLSPAYLMNFFSSPLGKNLIESSTEQGARFRLPFENLAKFMIQIPPLAIQEEIVSILDTFTELEAELEAELQARKRQFNHFVDELTSAGTASRLGGLTRPLGDLGEFVRGSGLQKSDLSHEGAPALHYGQIFTYYKTKIHAAKSSVAPKLAASIRQAGHGDVIIATTSENVEDVCKSVVWLGEGDLAVGGETYIFKHELDPLYATYLFRSSDFQYQKLSHISGTKVKRVSGKALEKMTVSVPDREAQVRIGSFLSQLEDLLGDVSQGLPAEIQARRRQYEYYRNKLLTFKELDAA